MKVSESQKVTKRTIELSGAEFMTLVQNGVVENGNTRIMVTEENWLPVIAELEDAG
jgi:hypothetical protein